MSSDVLDNLDFPYPLSSLCPQTEVDTATQNDTLSCDLECCSG